MSEKSSVILEIRAGAGGDEAALFASNLFKMYSKYSALQQWEVIILDSHKTEIGGLKQITFEIKGEDVFSKLKYEAGVHRVQRIPETEKAGRVHTSTVTVAVLPKPKFTEMNIRADELRIDHFRSSGPGGQNVNKRETAVRITHIPTGIVVGSQTERNQLKNKENALSILSAKLLEKKEEEAFSKLGGERKSQIGSAMRAEKIRTYNFPQDRITDHRAKKKWHNIEDVMEGRMDKMIKDLQKILNS
jgi:peptide chain release factor 1